MGIAVREIVADDLHLDRFPVAEVGRAEAVRDQLGDDVAFNRRAVATGAEDFDVAAAELRRLEDRLAAAATGSADGGIAAADDRDPGDLVEPECMLRGSQRALLGAQAKAVAGV